jgi:NCS2 family nucleobase:cation symporter-2
MAIKPPNLFYGVDDTPPIWTTVLLGIQHIFIISVYFVFPVIIVKSIGGSNAESENMIKMSMIAIGVTTILQALKKGPIGSGYLCPSGNGPAYLPAQILAAKTGGLSLVCGMVVVGGVMEGFFSRLVSKFRVLFPAEVAGLVVVMVGIELVPLGIKRFFFVNNYSTPFDITSFAIASLTYASMIGFNIWSKGWLRLYPILIGMVVGYLSSFLTGILTWSEVNRILEEPLIAVPRFASPGISFDMALVFPFVIATLCSSLKDIGDLTTCQKINDSDWKRCDMKNISKGILADSIGDIFSGLIGGLGQTTSSSNIGLSLATGATSRRIAYATGITLCGLAFFPKLASIFVIMPDPVMGAIVLFVANFMILAGIQIITTRLLDTRKIFVIGTALIFGLSIHIFPVAYTHIPSPFQTIFASGLFLSTLLVVILNLVFRIGISKQKRFSVQPEMTSLRTISDTIEEQGAAWGARKDVVERVKTVLNEFMESLIGLDLAREKVTIDIVFDEMNLNIVIIYEGELIDFEAIRPTESELLKDQRAVFRLSSLIIRQQVDRIKVDRKNGKCRVVFHFEH